MRALIRTFATRFIPQEEVDMFTFNVEDIDGMTVKDNDDIFIGRLCREQLENDEGEGIINDTERRKFFG